MNNDLLTTPKKAEASTGQLSNYDKYKLKADKKRNKFKKILLVIIILLTYIAAFYMGMFVESLKDKKSEYDDSAVNSQQGTSDAENAKSPENVDSLA